MTGKLTAGELAYLRARVVILEDELEKAVEALKMANEIDGYPGSDYDVVIRSAERVLRA